MTYRRPHKATLRALTKRFRAWLATRPGLRAYKHDPCGACAIFSEALTRFLRREGFDAEFVEGWFEPFVFETCPDHCWVEVAGKWIIDITASQFNENLPEVHIVPIDDDDYRAKRHGPYALRCVRRDWPKEQKPLGRVRRLPKELSR